MKKAIFLIVSFVVLFLVSPVYAQEEVSYRGVINEYREIPCSEMFQENYKCFEYFVDIQELDEEKVISPVLSENGESKFKKGDKVYVSSLSDEYGNKEWSITGYNRNSSILILVFCFSVLAIIIGGKQGMRSLISLLLTVLILYIWAIPRILAGSDVISTGLFAVFVMIIVIMYTAYGFNIKSHIGIVSCIVGILIVAIFVKLFGGLVDINGSGSEEAFLLFSQTEGSIDLLDVFFIGVLIGSVGVLDDVIMSQISSIFELYKTDSTLNGFDLYKKAMIIGKDHLSSMINTLFLAYAGSSLATVMLLTYNSSEMGNILQMDFIAEEIVRSLTASMGLLLIVPISSIIAAKIIPITLSKK